MEQLPCDELKHTNLLQKCSRENLKKRNVVMESHPLEDRCETDRRTTEKELEQRASAVDNSRLRLTKIRYKFLNK